MLRFTLTLCSFLCVATASLALDLPRELLRDLAPVDGKIILAVPEQTLIDRDAGADVHEGDLFAVLGPSEKIVHPQSGALLGERQTVKGWLRAARVRSGYTESVPLSPQTQVAFGDPVRRFSEADALLLDPQGAFAELYPLLQAGLPHLRWLGYFTDATALPAKGTTPRLEFSALPGTLEVRESVSGLLRRYPLTAPATVTVVPAATPVAMPPADTWNALSGSGVARALEVADLDGDGRAETITATLHGLEIGRFDGRLYHKLAERNLGLSHAILGLDACDSDGDGKMELWVTAHRDAELDSLVLLWDGQETLKPVVEHLGWWLRNLTLPATGRTLLAQRMGTDDFSGPIVRIALKDGKIVTSPTDLPSGIPLYGLARLRGENGAVTVRLNRFDQLQVNADSGELLQESEAIYGGTEAFLTRPDPNRSGSNSDNTRNVYPAPRFEPVASRYLLAPANLGSRAFARQRTYKESRLDLLEWDGAVLRPRITGRVEAGALVDYRYADLDNDGQKELVSLLTTARPGFTGKGRYLLLVNETTLPE